MSLKLNRFYQPSKKILEIINWSHILKYLYNSKSSFLSLTHTTVQNPSVSSGIFYSLLFSSTTGQFVTWLCYVCGIVLYNEYTFDASTIKVAVYLCWHLCQTMGLNGWQLPITRPQILYNERWKRWSMDLVQVSVIFLNIKECTGKNLILIHMFTVFLCN